jgi:hypothetical protein
VGLQRRPAAVAAAARTPARRAHGLDKARPWEHEGGVWMAPNYLVARDGLNYSSAASALLAGGAARRVARTCGVGEEGRRLNRLARPGDDGGVTRGRSTAHAGKETRKDCRSEGGRPAVTRRARRVRRVARR